MVEVILSKKTNSMANTHSRLQQTAEATPVDQTELASAPYAAIEKIGLLAITHSDQSIRVPFVSGAVGHTEAQIHIEGLPHQDADGHSSLILPSQPGNILLIPREALIDTHREILPYGNSISFGGEHLVKGIMRVLSGRMTGGVRYDAVMSYFDDPVKQAQEIVYATPRSQDAVTLYLPRPHSN